jgi:hypothetical protein
MSRTRGLGVSDELLRSHRANNTTGFKGVHSSQGRFKARCDKASCHDNTLGCFDTPEEAARVILQHYQKEHPEELEREQVPRPVLLPVQMQLLIRSDTNRTGYKGVQPNWGRFQVRCDTPPSCQNNNLGNFGTAEEAAQAYLQHQHAAHPEALNQRRGTGRQEHLLARHDRYEAAYTTAAPCQTNDMYGTGPEEAALPYFQRQQQRHNADVPLTKEKRLADMLADNTETGMNKKRMRKSIAETEHLSVPQVVINELGVLMEYVMASSYLMARCW